jgi:MarR family transcriptional regulator, organic hydroperoxide resistance regulator
MLGKKNRVITLDDHLCFALYGASMAVGRAYKPLLDEWGITYPQYLVLSALWEDGSQSPGALAARLALEPSTITPLVGRLEKAGFVTRERNPDDGRQIVVRLTEKGTGVCVQRACLARRLSETSGLSMKKLRKLAEDVRDLRDAVAAGAKESEPAS